MPDIAVIPTSPKPSEASSRRPGGPSDDTQTPNSAEQSFEAEYDAGTERPARLDHGNSAEDEAASSKASQNDDGSTDDGATPAAPVENTTVEDADFLNPEKTVSEAQEEISPTPLLADAKTSSGGAPTSKDLAEGTVKTDAGTTATLLPSTATRGPLDENRQRGLDATPSGTERPISSTRTPVESAVASVVMSERKDGPKGLPSTGNHNEIGVSAAQQTARSVGALSEMTAAQTPLNAKATAAKAEEQIVRKERVLERLTRVDAAHTPAVSPGVDRTLKSPTGSILQPVVAAKVGALTEKAEISPVILNDADSAFLGDARTNSATSTTSVTQILSRADTPTLIGRQMAEALQKLPDKPVEISLNPRELGRVRMNISASEVGITVNVLTERPETLDLMRRNIDQLAREFQAIGYENINFAFSEGTSQNASDTETGSDASSSDYSEIEVSLGEEGPVVQANHVQTTGLDLRM